MESNDRALLVGILGAVLLVWQWSGSEALRRENQQLQFQLAQTQQQFEAFRQGVLSR